MTPAIYACKLTWMLFPFVKLYLSRWKIEAQYR